MPATQTEHISYRGYLSKISDRGYLSKISDRGYLSKISDRGYSLNTLFINISGSLK